MDVLYDIDNPLFLDNKNDIGYITKTILPWFLKFITKIGKIEKLSQPVDEYLKQFTSNQSLIDVITQHFFCKTPAFFALSYFSLYLDYNYPVGGMGIIPEKISDFIIQNGGLIKTKCKINHIDCKNNLVVDEKGNEIYYKKMVWAADSKSLYDTIDMSIMMNHIVLRNILAQKELVLDKKGGDLILTVYMTLDVDVSEIKKCISEHVFYTPEITGLSNEKYLSLKKQLKSEGKLTDNKQLIFKWVSEYLQTTTYEISCPGIRDLNLVPNKKTGLIVRPLKYTL